VSLESEPPQPKACKLARPCKRAGSQKRQQGTVAALLGVTLNGCSERGAGVKMGGPTKAPDAGAACHV
jgi:hypothetical protein